MDACDFVIFVYSGDSRETREARLYEAARLYTGKADGVFVKRTTKTGKPYFQNMPELCFSISHSGGLWACAFGGAPVGLDMEAHRQCRMEDISKRFFHPTEDAYLKSHGFDVKTFFDLWCAKESYVKLTGEGIAALESFSGVDGTLGAELRRLPLSEGFSMCLCAEKIGKTELRKMF